MGKGIVAVLTAASLAAFGPLTVEGQVGEVTVEAGAGITMPTGDLDHSIPDLGARTGLVSGALATLAVHEHLGFSAGYGRDHFRCEAPACPGDADLSLDGPRGGVTVWVADFDGVRPWVRLLGTLYEPGFSGGDSFDREFGFQAGGGLDVPLTERFAVSPRAYWSQTGSEVILGEEQSRIAEPSYVNVEIAARLKIFDAW